MAMESQESSSSDKASFEEYLKYSVNQRLKQLRKVKANMEEIGSMLREIDSAKQHLESRKDRHPYRKLRPDDEDCLVEIRGFINGPEIKDAEELIKLRCSASGLKEIIDEIAEEARKNHEEGKEIPKSQDIEEWRGRTTTSMFQQTNKSVGLLAIDGGVIENATVHMNFNGPVKM